MNEIKKEIVSIIIKMSGSYTPYKIFSDWVKLCALSMQNGLYQIHNDVWNCREKQYIEIMSKYGSEERKNMMHMFGMLVEAFEDEISDILGEIYMESGCSSKGTGQFFTPFHISCMTAAAGLTQYISEEYKLRMNEPSSGGGGLIIAAAKVLNDRGIDYQRCMDVTAKDLDWNGVYMTYVQLGILGISATVIHGDALGKCESDENNIFYTPKKMGVIF